VLEVFGGSVQLSRKEIAVHALLCPALNCTVNFVRGKP
jgi:hypothetical protein